MRTQKNSSNKEVNILSTAFNWYLPYWPMFIVLVILGLAGAWAYLKYYANPTYEAYATIVVKDEKKGVDESGVLEALNIYPTKQIVENEIEVVRSRKLMEQVVEQLQLYAPVYEAPSFSQGRLQATSAYNTSPVTIKARNPDKLKDTSEVYFSVNYFTEKDIPRKKIKEVVIDNKAYPLGQWTNTPFGELKFESNDNQLSTPERKLFFSLNKTSAVTNSLINNLDVKAASKLSTVINLTLKDEVPQRGKDVLNRLLLSYNRLSQEEKKDRAFNTLALIETRLASVEKELDSIERKIQQFRASKGAVNLSEESRQYLENAGSNDRKSADLNMQLAALNEVEEYVNSKEDKAAMVPSTIGVEDPVLLEMMQKMYTARVEYEKLRKTTGENNPLATVAAKEIEQIRPMIMEKLRNNRVSLQASIKNLASTTGTYNAMLRTIPEKEREYMDISRAQQIKSNIYSFLLEKREQAIVSSSSVISDSKIIDMAESSIVPVSPKKTLVYAVALVVALGLGIALVSGKELLNRKIMFRSEIETLAPVPVLAEISAAKKKDALLKTSSKTSMVAEQFRQLRAAIGLLKRQKNMAVKRILVTSNIPGEGKTYISTNLAMSLALAGNKVILVDMDIRLPKTSAVMGVMETAGVSEFLDGSKKPEEIIKQTDKHENLYTISAGAGEDHARELILTGQLNNLLIYLDTTFDYIVLDASPIDPVPDSFVFSEFCDITLFVVRHGRTPKMMVQMLEHNTKFKALKNPYIVFNGIQSRGILKGMYGYSYGYGYDNVYRNSEKRKMKLMRGM